MKLKLLMSLISTCYLSGLLAQTNDSVILAAKPNFQTKLYYDSLGTSPSIYTGTEHRFPSIRIEGHPYFYIDEFDRGDIYYNGFLYENIEATYDTHLQMVLVEHDNISRTIRLDTDKIEHFKIFNHQFIRLETDSVSGMKNGFYDLVVDGKVKFLVRREKELRKEIENQAVRQWFDPIEKYYLYKDGTYNRVKRKRQLLKLLEDKKKELKVYIRNQRISISAFPENGFEKIINYYNQL